MGFNFGDIVVVDHNRVGVVVKCWQSRTLGNHYEVYVRSYNAIKEYQEFQIVRFLYDKELSDEAMAYY